MMILFQLGAPGQIATRHVAPDHSQEKRRALMETFAKYWVLLATNSHVMVSVVLYLVLAVEQHTDGSSFQRLYITYNSFQLAFIFCWRCVKNCVHFFRTVKRN